MLVGLLEAFLICLLFRLFGRSGDRIPTWCVFFQYRNRIPKYCVLPYPPRTVSNERDLAVSCTIRFHPRVAECFLSLRSAGCVARIVLLVEPGHVIEPSFRYLLATARAEVVAMPGTGYKSVFHNRWSWVLDYLRDHVAEYDRVLWFDSFDVFFQGDPFDVINPVNVTLFTEGVLIGRCPINSWWLKGCFGESLVRSVADKPLLNGGVAAGPAGPFLKFLSIFIRKPEDWVNCSICQIHLNYLAHTGAFRRAGVGYVIRGCDAAAHLHWCPADWQPFYVNRKMYVSKLHRGKPPPIVHANGRAKKQIFNLIERCAVWITDHAGPGAVSRDDDPDGRKKRMRAGRRTQLRKRYVSRTGRRRM
jgi:hypothetical protein